LKVATFIVPKIFVVPAVGEKVVPIAVELNTPPAATVILVAGEAVVVAFKTPPLLIVTLEPAPEAEGLKVGVVKVPEIDITIARPVGMADVVGRTLPPVLIVTVPVGANVVEFSVPLTLSIPSGVDVPVEVIVPVDPMVVVETAVGLNEVVVIVPSTLSVPAGAEVVVAVRVPPLSTVVVKPATGPNVVTVVKVPPDFTLRLPAVTVLAAATLFTLKIPAVTSKLFARVLV
jgi:hypothetical protein